MLVGNKVRQDLLGFFWHFTLSIASTIFLKYIDRAIFVSVGKFKQRMRVRSQKPIIWLSSKRRPWIRQG
jgi:hypothetical protein